MHSRVSIYNELTQSFYSEEIGSPITLSSFLQLNTDQLMTTNETQREIVIQEYYSVAERKKSMRSGKINYKLQLTANPTERQFSSHVYIDTS